MTSAKNRKEMHKYMLERIRESYPEAELIKDYFIPKIETVYVKLNGGAVWLIDKEYPAERKGRNRFLAVQSRMKKRGNLSAVFLGDGKTFRRFAEAENKFEDGMKHYSRSIMKKLIKFRPEEMAVFSANKWDERDEEGIRFSIGSIQYYLPESGKIATDEYISICPDYSHLGLQFREFESEWKKIHILNDEVELEGKIKVINGRLIRGQGLEAVF